jgi:hypothetical protein
MKESDWPNGYSLSTRISSVLHLSKSSYGQLTAVGIEQQRRLGEYFRHRYGSILSLTYTPSELVVRSTNFTRTLMSARSNLAGLYPTGNLSNGTVTIPVHTVPLVEDFVCRIQTTKSVFIIFPLATC